MRDSSYDDGGLESAVMRQPVAGLSVMLVGAAALAGCAGSRPAPVRGYAASIQSAAWVPGQPGRFRVRLRLRRVDGKPLPGTLPGVYLNIPQPRGVAFWATYSTRMNFPPGRRFCDVTIGGRHRQPPASPVTIGVELREFRPLPWWKHFLYDRSVTREVSASSTLGYFTLPGITAPTAAPRRAPTRPTSVVP